MSPPKYFTVEYVINPWMAGNVGSLDIELAFKQWETLRDSLSEVAEILLKAGFGSVSSLYVEFTKVFGQSLDEYRRSLQKSLSS